MNDAPISPLAPSRFPNALPVPGVEFAVTASGLRYRGRDDLLVCRFCEGAEAAQLLTRSKTPGAPVLFSRAAQAASGGRIRALMVNAGNANALTGPAGEAAAECLAEAVATRLSCSTDEIRLAATGVIGMPFDPAPVLATLDRLEYASGGWQRAARAIMTTDTFPKGASELAKIDGEPVVITGITKGSGMIRPDMATMLAFVFTNARLPAEVLDALLRSAAERSFHAITVDGDTSTSDMLLMVATGEAARHAPIERADDPRLDEFRMRLERLMIDLAQQVVRDGEGAQKFVAVTVTGARDKAAARRVAFTIAESPLVKTAIAGGDPNWGRIMAAAGRSGAVGDDFARWRLWIGGVPVVENGGPRPDYREEEAARHMTGREIAIRLDLGEGADEATVWTCDLTKRYIEINADYRS